MNKTALQYSVKLLSKKDYSEFKLRLKLSSKEFESSLIDEAINMLKSKKYLDEQRYAENKVISLLQRNYGNLLIINKLDEEKIKINSEMINQLRIERNLTEDIIIKALIKKKLQFPQKISRDKLKQKISIFLNSKGFDFYSFEDYLEELI